MTCPDWSNNPFLHLVLASAMWRWHQCPLGLNASLSQCLASALQLLVNSLVRCSNNMECRLQLPPPCLQSIKCKTQLHLSRVASGRSLLFDDNPGSSKCSIKWNQFLTLSISLLIESDVSGFGAKVSLPISLAFLSSVCLWSPSGLGMWGIYSGYTKEHNPAGFDHLSVITQMIGLQTMAYTCALWECHLGEHSFHPHGSQLVKS